VGYEDFREYERRRHYDGTNSMGVAGFVCGLLGVVFVFLPCGVFIGTPLIILGLVLSCVGMSRPNPGLATAGVVLSLIGAAV
jgi:hypothetical protein